MDLSKLSDAELDALYAQAKQAQSKKSTPEINPMDGIPWHQQFREGMGKAFVDMGRGVGQLVGAVSREDVDESKKRDASLMDTGWGMAGNIAGNVIPAVAMPASTLPRAIASGAALGFSQPVGTNDSRTENTIIGAGLNGLLPAASMVYKGGRAIAEPVLAPQRTAARVIEQFADDPQALRNAAKNAQELVPGSRPTLAQVAQQPGISTLERSSMNQPGPMQAALTQRYAEQNAARMSALRGVSKDDAAMQAAVSARESAAKPGYDAAKAILVTADDDLNNVLNRPSMKDAWGRAVRLAKENGETLTVGVDAPATKVTTGILDEAGNDIMREAAATSKEYSGRGLHYLKMALDDMIDGGTMSGIGKHEQRALLGTKEKLLSWMDTKIPEYGGARKAYAEKSQPINEMQFGRELEKRISPALSQVAGTDSRLLPNSYASALRDSESSIRKATGKDLSVDQVLSPGAKDSVYGIAKDMDRAARAQGLGKPAGSPTAQFLTTQNLMRQVMGPMGLPNGMADKAASSLMSTPVIGSALQWGTKGAEQRVQQEVANLLLDPKALEKAAQMLHTTPGVLKKSLGLMAPYAPATLTSGLLSQSR